MSDELASKSNRKLAGSYFIVLFLSGLLYITTCAPTIVWQDSALFTWRIWNNDLQGDIGIALAHPLYILVGSVLKSIPFGSFAYRLNLFSAICGAIAVANVFLLLRLWLNSYRAAIIAAITLAVSWTFWQHAVVAEVYTLYAAQMLTELIILLLFMRSRKIAYLYLLAFLNGLSLSNHNWALFCLACYAVLFIVCRKEIKLWHLFVLPLAFIAGAWPYLYLMAQDYMFTGDLGATISSALFGTLWKSNVTNISISAKLVAENIVFILMNFATPNIIFLFIGIWYLIKRSSMRYFSNIILILSAMYLVFAFRYGVVDRYAFFLPFYCFGAIFIGVGADAFLKSRKKKIWIWLVLSLAFMPAVIYAFTPDMARKYYPSLTARRQLPYKDIHKYFLQPWKTNYRGAEKFAHEALDATEKGAVLWVDSTVVHLMLYIQQSEDYRSDVRITSLFYKGSNAKVLDEQTATNILNESAIYVVSPMKGYCPDYLLKNYDFEQVWPIYKVIPKK